MATMKQLAEIINGGNEVAAAQAAAEARKRFDNGDTEGCRHWQDWVAKRLKRGISRTRFLIRAGNSGDPKKVLDDARKHHRELLDRLRRERGVPQRGLSQKKQLDHAKLDREKQKLNLPPRRDSRSFAVTDHVEHEYTNILSAWNNSQPQARARFLAAIGINLQIVPDVA